VVDYTDYQQRALYGAGQAAQRAGQRFHMERDALQRGDTAAAKYHRSRANALNRQGAYSAVRGMGGNQGANQYFPVQSSGQPIQAGSGIALSSAGRDIFDRFRDTGFVEPIRQKKRYAPNTEPRGLEFLMDQAMKNTMFAKMAEGVLPKKDPEPDDAYYKSLYGDGLNELYGPSGIFTMGKFLGKPDLDPYYTGDADKPMDYSGFMEPKLVPKEITFLPQEEYEGSGMKTNPFYNYVGASADAPDITNDIVGDSKDTITNTYLEEVVKPEKVPLYNLDQYYQLNPTAPGLFGDDYSGVQEYINSIVNDPDNPNYKRDVQDLLKELIKKGYVVEGRSD
jgi:hypothetical protein